MILFFVFALGVLSSLTVSCFGASNIVRASLLFAAGLIFALASISSIKDSVHPDEFSHWPVYHYYAEHWMPPAVDDPAVKPSLSAWGYSYLFELNATYWIAARVMSAASGLFGSELYAARAFQCLLWTCLCWLAWRRREAAIALSVLLLSPQIWYVFAYFNSDAFPLFAALVAVLLLGGARSDVRDYVSGSSFTWRVLLFTACLGLLLICKANYAVLVPGLMMWLAVLYMDLRWRELLPTALGLALLGAAVFMGDAAVGGANARIATVAAGLLVLGAALFGVLLRCRGDISLQRTLRRLVYLMMLAAAVAAPRIGFDIYANGMPSTKSARILAVEEATAIPDLKPSALEQGKGAEYATGLARRGVGLTQMFQSPYRWLSWSAISTFGVYGYMNVVAPYVIYIVLLVTSLIVVLLCMVGMKRVQPEKAPRLIFIAAALSVLVVESSLLHSWIDAFQAQGRYLFPIFAILALMLATAGAALPRRPFRFAIAVAALASTYSFLFVALPAFGHG